MSDMLKNPTADDLVDIGEEHHKAGRLQEAEKYYRETLAIDPGHPGALYYLANIAYEDGRLPFATQLVEELLRGDSNDAEAWHLSGVIALKKENYAEAIESLNNALAIQPVYAQAHYSLGCSFSKQENLDAALTNFRQAAALDPTFAEAHFAIGNILQTQKQFDEALSNYQKALNVKADFALAYEKIGEILTSHERWDEAITIFSKAIAENAASASIYTGLGIAYLFKAQMGAAMESLECARALDSQDPRVLENLATAFYSFNEIEKTVEIYRKLLTLEPDNPIARHHLAARTHAAVPVRADDAYIEHTFDSFAEKFDTTLEKLDYCAPQLLTEALQRACGVARKQFAILDAGCGTGLCGPLIASYASQLTGVDLSAGMLAKAESRDVYDALIKAELTAYLQSQVNAFDIIFSADTLNYFGELENVFSAARGALRDNGYLFFTLEKIADDAGDQTQREYHLNPHGRYSHNETHLRRKLGNAGFLIDAIEAVILRREGNLPVQGLVVTCRPVANGHP